MTGDLQPEAIDLLAAILGHLNIPLPVEGNKQARRDYRDLLAMRVEDVVAALESLLAVPAAEATAHADQLRTFTAETRARYATTPKGDAQ